MGIESETMLREIREALQNQAEDAALVSVTTAEITFLASSATTVMLLQANGARHGLIVVNTDANDLWLKYGTTAGTASGGWTVKIGSGTTWEMPQPIYSGRIDGIWTAAGVGIAEMTEF